MSSNSSEFSFFSDDSESKEEEQQQPLINQQQSQIKTSVNNTQKEKKKPKLQLKQDYLGIALTCNHVKQIVFHINRNYFEYSQFQEFINLVFRTRSVNIGIYDMENQQQFLHNDIYCYSCLYKYQEIILLQMLFIIDNQYVSLEKPAIELVFNEQQLQQLKTKEIILLNIQEINENTYIQLNQLIQNDNYLKCIENILLQPGNTILLENQLYKYQSQLVDDSKDLFIHIAGNHIQLIQMQCQQTQTKIIALNNVQQLVNNELIKDLPLNITMTLKQHYEELIISNAKKIYCKYLQIQQNSLQLQVQYQQIDYLNYFVYHIYGQIENIDLSESIIKLKYGIFTRSTNLTNFQYFSCFSEQTYQDQQLSQFESQFVIYENISEQVAVLNYKTVDNYENNRQQDNELLLNYVQQIIKDLSIFRTKICFLDVDDLILKNLDYNQFKIHFKSMLKQQLVVYEPLLKMQIIFNQNMLSNQLRSELTNLTKKLRGYYFLGDVDQTYENQINVENFVQIDIYLSYLENMYAFDELSVILFKNKISYQILQQLTHWQVLETEYFQTEEIKQQQEQMLQKYINKQINRIPIQFLKDWLQEVIFEFF